MKIFMTGFAPSYSSKKKNYAINNLGQVEERKKGSLAVRVHTHLASYCRESAGSQTRDRLARLSAV